MPDFRTVARQAAIRNGIDPNLFLRQINQESGFQVAPSGRDAQGRILPNGSGAVGIAQIVPRWHPNVDARDPIASLNYAAHLMGSLTRKYGSYERALSAYNSGRPDAYKDPKFAGGQTFNYVRTIMGGASLSGQTPPPASSLAPPSVPVSAGGVPGVQRLLAQSLAEGNRMLGLPNIPLPTLTASTTPTFAPAPLPPARVSAPLPAPSRAGGTVGALEQFASPYGLTVTSTNGGRHAPHSYHYQGRAVDFGGDPARMAQLAKAALAHPRDFVEFIYTGPGNPGYSILDGRVIPNSSLDRALYDQHTNHVHLAR